LTNEENHFLKEDIDQEEFQETIEVEQTDETQISLS
jgi:hypothetical protein